MRNLIAALLLLAPAISAGAQLPQPSGLCPPGYNELFNVNQPGCTFCSAPDNCQVECLGSPTCLCPPGDSTCCENSPCCDNCPEPKPLSCDTASCECQPGTCCSLVCPAPAPAPASSAGGLVALAAVLAALGAGAARVATRKR